MEPKVLTEIKQILKKFPRFSDAGFVVFPVLGTLAHKLGLPGYMEAVTCYMNGDILTATGSAEGLCIHDLDKHDVFLSWEGPAIRKVGNKVFVGLEETLRNVELASKGGVTK